MRLRWSLVPVLGLTALQLALARPAAADDVEQRAAARLAQAQVFIDAAAEAKPLVVSQPLARAISTAPVRIAVMPAATAVEGEPASAVADRLVAAIGRPDLVVITLVGTRLSAAAGAASPVTGSAARAIATQALAAHAAGGFTAENVQAALLDAVASVRAAQVATPSPSPSAEQVVGDPVRRGPPAGLVVGGAVAVVVGVALVAALSAVGRRRVTAHDAAELEAEHLADPSHLDPQPTEGLPAPAERPPVHTVGAAGTWTGGAWPQVALSPEA